MNYHNYNDNYDADYVTQAQLAAHSQHEVKVKKEAIFLWRSSRISK